MIVTMTASKLKLYLKRFVRRIYSQIVALIAKCLNRKNSLSSLLCVGGYFKRSSGLLLVAPGSSLNTLTSDDWAKFENYDRIFVNYAAMHDQVRAQDMLSTEPHLNIHKFSEVFAQHHGPLLFKGFTSLSNLHICLKSLWALRKRNGPTLLVQEIDASDLYNFPEVDDYYNDYFSSPGLSKFAMLDGASLTYFLVLGLRLGYSTITLVGFDFDNEYFFETRDQESPENNEKPPNPTKHNLVWDKFFIRKLRKIYQQACISDCSINSFKAKVDISDMVEQEN